jgi:hypothetical protein
MRGWTCASAVAVVFLAVPVALASAQGVEQLLQGLAQEAPGEGDPLQDLAPAAVRLPLAALLGAGLALRPRRRGTPARRPPVIQTQIMLSVVGAVIMIVIGASLARAFGIVGAANLIRYRSKIDDPKDAVVMLCTLAVGLACGVGLYALAAFATVFIGAALWIIESFEPESVVRFTLRIKASGEADELRGPIERVLARHGLGFDLRASSNDEISYDVQVPHDRGTETISDDLLALDRKDTLAVEWEEKTKTK